MILRSKCDRCGRVGSERLIGHDCPNLWERQACAGAMQRYEIIEHVGICADRLNWENATRERCFAERWASENKQGEPRTPTLAALLGRTPTQEEATAVATVIQWLGSNVGHAFLLEVQAEIIRQQEAASLPHRGGAGRGE